MKHKYPRLLSVLCALMIATSASWAVPAYRGWQQRTLADGTTITVRQVGDEFYHYWETEDGKIAVEQPDGTFVVNNEQAPTGEQVVARRIAARNAKQPRRAKADYGAIQPTKLLVLLVNFSDKSMNSSHNKAFFQNLLNGSLPSVQDYFRTSSGGNYVPVFDVFGPYTMPNNMAYYGGNDSDGNDQHPDQMVVDACALAAADGCNFANYDTNNDGKVDNIYVIYAGYGEAAGAPANTIWPHSWEIYSSNVTGTLKYNNKYLGHYACSAELSGKSGSNSDGVGTFAHEFSHVIGLPDYYDTDYGTNSNNGVTPGEWTLMDQGSYNGSGQYPPLYSIYDKYFMGWATPKFLAKDEVKNVTMTTAWDDAYQITGGTSRVACTSTSTVYYVENRQKSGYDQYLPGHGMLVWKVTYNATRWSKNDLNNTAGTLRYTIVPADGKTRNYGAGSDPFPGTASKKSWTPFTGCALTEIAESAGNISFKYNGGVTKTKCTYEFVAENCTTPADGEVAMNAALNVTITANSGYTLADASCWTVEMGGVELTYGSGFTYNASTGAFSITSLTDDVVIMAEAKRIYTVTWSVNGSTTPVEYVDGSALTLPSKPSDCPGGKKFVGWTASTSVTGDKPADLFAAAGTKTVTANVTYYAVYATASTGGVGPATWDLVTDASSLRSGDILVIASNTQGKTAGDISSQVMTEVESTFSSDKSSITSLGSGTIELTLGGTEGEWTLTSSNGKLGATAVKKLAWDGGTQTWSISISSGDATIQNGTDSYGRFLHNTGSTRFTTYTSSPSVSMLLPQLYRKSAGVTYSDYTTTCVVCALASISLNTDAVQKSFATDDTFNSTGLVVTASYSNCSSRTVTPTNVSTPDLSSAGDKTVTVTYTENEVTKTATYTINVAAVVKHTVTWKTCGGTTFKTVQVVDGDPLVLPSPAPGANTEGKAFFGWTTEEHYTGADAPAMVTAGGEVNADATYYAVYK